MNRKTKRVLKKEKDLIKEIFKIVKQYFPDLLDMLGNLTDVRHQSYIDYSMKVVIVTRLLALLSGINTMDGITDKMYDENTVKNISNIVSEKIDEMPHEDTINNVFVTLNETELRAIQKYMCNSLIRSKMIDKYRYKGYFQILVDATGLYSSRIKYNDSCLIKNKKDKEGNEYKEYSTMVLEAKLVAGPLILSFDTEFIENSDYDETIVSEELRKQDCEIKAFKRMASRIKNNYPKLPIIICGDSLYASRPVMEICKNYNWHYLIRFKKGSIPTLGYEFEKLEKTVKGAYMYDNNVVFGSCQKDIGYTNVISYKETKASRKTEFVYITSIEICSKNYKDIVTLGRKRWKIENEGFNNQKNNEYSITHLCSRHDVGLKSHYYLIQISDIIKQLLCHGSKELKGLKLKIKEVSALILETLTHIISDLSNLERLQLRFDDISVT